jgi:hypothetical protein
LLVSKRALSFGVAKAQHGMAPTTVLAYTPVGGRVMPVAVISSVGERAGTLLCVDRLALRDDLADGIADGVADQSDQQLAVVEHLYGLVLNQDAYASFCLADNRHRCSRGDTLSQAEVFRRLALALMADRRHVLVVLGTVGLGVILPWQFKAAEGPAIGPRHR